MKSIDVHAAVSFGTIISNIHDNPDHCVWWEAVNLKTNCADYHATTKKQLIDIIKKSLEV